MLNSGPACLSSPSYSNERKECGGYDTWLLPIWKITGKNARPMSLALFWMKGRA